MKLLAINDRFNCRSTATRFVERAQACGRSERTSPPGWRVQTMKASLLMRIKAGRRLLRIVHTRPLALCLLVCFSAMPAIADTATFSESASATVSAPTVASVTYSAVAAPGSPFLTLFSNDGGYGGLVYGPLPSFSFAGGVLALDPTSANGWVDSLSPDYDPGVEIFYKEVVDLYVTNSNSHEVEIPFTFSLNYTVAAASNPALPGELSPATSFAETYMEYFSHYPGEIGSPSGGLAADCYSSEALYFDCVAAGDPAVTPTYGSGQISGTIAETVDISVPANDELTLEVDWVSDGSAFPATTPEPGTLTLLGTGLGVLVGIVRRRARRG